MSIPTILEMRGERQDEVNKAIHHRDEEKLFKLANQFAKEQDYEYAETLRLLAQKAYNENWAHDRARDEELCLEGINV